MAPVNIYNQFGNSGIPDQIIRATESPNYPLQPSYSQARRPDTVSVSRVEPRDESKSRRGTQSTEAGTLIQALKASNNNRVAARAGEQEYYSDEEDTILDFLDTTYICPVVNTFSLRNLLQDPSITDEEAYRKMAEYKRATREENKGPKPINPDLFSQGTIQTINDLRRHLTESSGRERQWTKKGAAPVPEAWKLMTISQLHKELKAWRDSVWCEHMGTKGISLKICPDCAQLVRPENHKCMFSQSAKTINQKGIPMREAVQVIASGSKAAVTKKTVPDLEEIMNRISKLQEVREEQRKKTQQSRIDTQAYSEEQTQNVVMEDVGPDVEVVDGQQDAMDTTVYALLADGNRDAHKAENWASSAQWLIHMTDHVLSNAGEVSDIVTSRYLKAESTLEDNGGNLKQPRQVGDKHESAGNPGGADDAITLTVPEGITIESLVRSIKEGTFQVRQAGRAIQLM